MQVKAIKNNIIQQAMLAGAGLVLTIAFPQIFHHIGLGAAFLPMFLPVLLIALFSSKAGLGVLPALLGPASSWLLTGMPAVPAVFMLTIELLFLFSAVYIARARNWNLYAAVPAVLITGRALSMLLLCSFGGMPVQKAYSFIFSGYPGLLVLLVTGTVLIWLKTRFASDEI
jgi:hypothetical protein